jgi:hypothetical protein
MGEYTDVASAKRAMRGVLTSGESESFEFRFSRVVTVADFLSLVVHETGSGRESLMERATGEVKMEIKMCQGGRDDNLDPAQLSTSRKHTE